MFLLFGSFIISGQNDKKRLMVQLLIKANSFEDIQNVVPIIKNENTIFKYVPSIHPIAEKNKPRVSSQFGGRIHPIDQTYKYHAGIDFVAEFATSIHATADGEVVFAGDKGGYGKCVIIEHEFGFVTIYAHLTEFYTKKGRKEKKGNIIAFLGNTGKSTGSHLHYEIKKNNKAINPTNFLNL